MLKKIAIFGIFLLIAGAAVLRWNVAKKETEQKEIAAAKLMYGSEADKYLQQYDQWLQLAPQEQHNTPFTLNQKGMEESGAQRQLNQQGRLKANLDRLAGPGAEICPFSDILYGENWRNEVDRYKKRQEKNEFALTTSIACTSAGAAITLLSVLICILKLAARRLSILGHFLEKVTVKSHRHPVVREALNRPKDTPPQPHPADRDRDARRPINNRTQAAPLKPQSPAGAQTTGTALAYATLGPANLNLLLSDARSGVYLNSSGVASDQPRLSLGCQERTAPGGTATLEADPIQDSLKGQAESLEKQMEEVRQMAESVQKTSLEQAKPLNSTLAELAQQVSAIRDYAAHQQERVEKLQDGYDWNIIRTFCLRVIRCVDNLETRIQRLAANEIDTTDIEEVRDELLFALESSGVEQFKPKVNTDYRGHEKYAEAVKDRHPCEDESQTGKIARVIRPGYQYFINEDNTKVVRTAQVKLYG